MRRLMMLLLAATALPALAQTAGEPAPIGQQTRAWLDLQASNSAALGAPEPVPGEVATRVYERYLKSFEHPIPEDFEREAFVESGGQGG